MPGWEHVRKHHTLVLETDALAYNNNTEQLAEHVAHLTPTIQAVAVALTEVV